MKSLRAKLFNRLGLRYVSLRSSVRGKCAIGYGCMIAKYSTIDGSDGGGIEIGNGCHIWDGCIISSYGGSIRIDDGTHINPYCVLYGHGGLAIGKNCLIATGCVFVPANHNFSDPSLSINQQGLTALGISIGDNVWIGARAIILDGVSIGSGSVIGAGSVVTKSIGENCVAFGNPAVVRRSRLENR